MAETQTQGKAEKAERLAGQEITIEEFVQTLEISKAQGQALKDACKGQKHTLKAWQAQLETIRSGK